MLPCVGGRLELDGYRGTSIRVRCLVREWSDSQASLGEVAKNTETTLQFRRRVFRQLKHIYEQTEEMLQDVERLGSIHDNSGEFYIRGSRSLLMLHHTDAAIVDPNLREIDWKERCRAQLDEPLHSLREDLVDQITAYLQSYNLPLLDPDGRVRFDQEIGLALFHTIISADLVPLIREVEDLLILRWEKELLDKNIAASAVQHWIGNSFRPELRSFANNIQIGKGLWVQT